MGKGGGGGGISGLTNTIQHGYMINRHRQTDNGIYVPNINKLDKQTIWWGGVGYMYVAPGTVTNAGHTKCN